MYYKYIIARFFFLAPSPASMSGQRNITLPSINITDFSPTVGSPPCHRFSFWPIQEMPRVQEMPKVRSELDASPNSLSSIPVSNSLQTDIQLYESEDGSGLTMAPVNQSVRGRNQKVSDVMPSRTHRTELETSFFFVFS